MMASGASVGSVTGPASGEQKLPGWPVPLLALAPMQDVTDRAFWELLHRYGGADVYFTEYFRVYATSVPDREICASITRNPTGRPVVAQVIGNDLPALVRTVEQLQALPVAGIDFNLGCPAPVVYRKCAGGGLLRDLPRVERILGALRDAVRVKFSVKTRVGFDTPAAFEALLGVLGGVDLDLVTVHGRTVAGGYRSAVRYDLIARAAEVLRCPVLANGNVYAARQAVEVLAATGARGLMIGRGAIRNPWLFAQIRQVLRGEIPECPRGRDVLGYVEALYEATGRAGLGEAGQVQRVKKHLNFIGLGIEASGRFLEAARRARTRGELGRLFREWLDHDEPMALEPLPVPLGERDVLAGEQR